MKTLCDALGQSAWLVDQNDKHDTIESLIKTFNKDKPFKGIFMNFCIAGKEYTGKQGHTNYELFLPKFNKSGAPFEALDVTPSKLATFVTTEHIEKSNAPSEVANFESGEHTDNTSTDFNLD